ncbi:MAG: hypothetical protein ACLFPN_06270 [Methanomassiliicoccales archaeon]
MELFLLTVLALGLLLALMSLLCRVLFGTGFIKAYRREYMEAGREVRFELAAVLALLVVASLLFISVFNVGFYAASSLALMVATLIVHITVIVGAINMAIKGLWTEGSREAEKVSYSESSVNGR